MKTIGQKEIRKFLKNHCPHPAVQDGCQHTGCDYYHIPEGCRHPDYPKFFESALYRITIHALGQEPETKSYTELAVAIDQFQKMTQDKKPNTNYRLSSANGKSIIAIYQW